MNLKILDNKWTFHILSVLFFNVTSSSYKIFSVIFKCNDSENNKTWKSNLNLEYYIKEHFNI